MDLRKDPINKLLWQIGFPASVGFFFQTMYNIVDTYFAGRISTESLAALTISFPVFFFIIVIAEGLTTGASAVISNAIGESDAAAVKKYSCQTISYGLFCAVALMLLGGLISEPVFKFLGATDHYLELALIYIYTIFGGSIFFTSLCSFNAILFSHGNSWARRNAQVAGFFLNCIFVPWFMFGGFGMPPLGFNGIGIATVTVVAFTAFYIIAYVIYHGYLRHTTWRDFIPQAQAFKELFKQSFPASLNLMTITLGIMVIMYFLKDYNTSAMAAFGIGMRIEQLVLLPSVGLLVATITIVGQNNGAKQFERVQETMYKALRVGTLITIVGAFFMYFFPEKIFAFFTQDPAVISSGVNYLSIGALTSGAYMVCSLTVAALQGMKHPLYALFMGMTRQVLLPFPIYYAILYYFHGELTTMWWALCTITWAAAIFSFFYARWIIRKKYIQN